MTTQFVEKWTNAPFLIRNDTGKLLRESDLVKDGHPRKFRGLGQRKQTRRGMGIGKGGATAPAIPSHP